MKTALYARISRDPEEQREGVDRQLERGREIATERGWQVVAEFSDNDLSGFKEEVRRPGFEALKGRIANDGIELVLVQHQDRLARNVQTFRAFADLCRDHDIRLETFSGPVVIDSATGRFTSTVQSAVDEHYSAILSEKIQAVVDERARRGQPNGGRRAFGYLSGQDAVSGIHNLEIDRNEAAVVREIYSRFLDGDSIRSIRLDLNDREIISAAGNPFSNRGVRDLLRNPRYAGLRTHKGEIVADATWDPIIDRPTWERAQSILTAPGRRDWRGGPRRYYLTGLLECGTCGHRLIARPQRHKRAYGCPSSNDGGCGGSRVIAEPLEEYVTGIIFDTLNRPEVVDRLAGTRKNDPSGAIVGEIATIEQRQMELAELFAGGQVTARQLATATNVLEQQLADFRTQLEAAQLADVGAAALDPHWVAEVWDSQTVAWRGRVAAVLIQKIIVHPAIRGRNFFYPERLEVIQAASVDGI